MPVTVTVWPERLIPLDVETVSVSASVGVATAQDSTNAGDLLALADLALYAAKQAGRQVGAA